LICHKTLHYTGLAEQTDRQAISLETVALYAWRDGFYNLLLQLFSHNTYVTDDGGRQPCQKRLRHSCSASISVKDRPTGGNIRNAAC